MTFTRRYNSLIISLELKDTPTRGNSFQKFNISLTSNAEYVEKLENQIFETLRLLDQNKITDKRLRWEHFKARDQEIYNEIFKKLCQRGE